MGCRLIQGMKRVGSSEVVLGSNTAVVRGRVLGDRNSVRGRPRCLCVCRGGTSASRNCISQLGSASPESGNVAPCSCLCMHRSKTNCSSVSSEVSQRAIRSPHCFSMSSCGIFRSLNSITTSSQLRSGLPGRHPSCGPRRLALATSLEWNQTIACGVFRLDGTQAGWGDC